MQFNLKGERAAFRGKSSFLILSTFSETILILRIKKIIILISWLNVDNFILMLRFLKLKNVSKIKAFKLRVYSVYLFLPLLYPSFPAEKEKITLLKLSA